MKEAELVGEKKNSLKYGRHLDLPDPDYRKIKAVSKSGLDWLDISPAHYKHVILDGNAQKATPAMTLGSAFDCLLLTPEIFEQTYAIAPEARRGTKAWEEFEAANPGKQIIKADDLAQLSRMRDAVMAHPLARGLLVNGKPQVSFTWRDPITGVDCKSRADFQRNDSVLIDVKTTGEGGGKPETFMRTAYAMRYHVQAAFYSDGVIFTGPYPDAFLFVVIEREPPYPVSVFAADSTLIAAGQVEYRRNLNQYARCLETNEWPGYPQDIQTLRLPGYASFKE